MSAVIGGSLIGGLIIFIILLPLLFWWILIFPNVDGVMQDVDWFNYDDESGHYIFWSGFWLLMVGSTLGAIKSVTSKR